MKLLDIGLELSEGLQPRLDPLHVLVVLLLPVLEDSVGVELARVVHLEDEGGWGGAYSYPSQGGNGLRQSGEVIEKV